MSDYCITSLCTYDHIISCQYRDRRNDEYHIKQYYTPHAFENVYIDVMHNHDDKHPAWSESEKDRLVVTVNYDHN